MRWSFLIFCVFGATSSSGPDTRVSSDHYNGLPPLRPCLGLHAVKPLGRRSVPRATTARSVLDERRKVEDRKKKVDGQGEMASALSMDLGGVISGNRMAGVPLGQSLGSGEVDVEGVCSEPGMTCLNCTHAITCVPLPVGYLKVPLQQCSGKQTCNAHLGGCSETAVPECEDTTKMYTHTCEQVGIFPDAHDCRKFHLCSPPEGLPNGRPADHRIALCPRHYGYNPQTAQCSVKLHKGQCSEKNVPTCITVGQFGPVGTSLNHYFVCLQRKNLLYPQVFLCPHGWFFWDGFCHPEERPMEKSTAKVETTTLRKTTELPEVKSRMKTSEERSEEGSPMNSWLDNFFSTEKATTYKADAFLADKFDLTNYETTDDQAGQSIDYGNSFESW